MRLRTRSGLGSVRREAPVVRTTRRKGLLFCPGCGHQSHVDGDWIYAESGGRGSYACPDCGSLVVSQPTFPRANAA